MGCNESADVHAGPAHRAQRRECTTRQCRGCPWKLTCPIHRRDRRPSAHPHNGTRPGPETDINDNTAGYASGHPMQTMCLEQTCSTTTQRRLRASCQSARNARKARQHHGHSNDTVSMQSPCQCKRSSLRVMPARKHNRNRSPWTGNCRPCPRIMRREGLQLATYPRPIPAVCCLHRTSDSATSQQMMSEQTPPPNSVAPRMAANVRWLHLFIAFCAHVLNEPRLSTVRPHCPPNREIKSNRLRRQASHSRHWRIGVPCDLFRVNGRSTAKHARKTHKYHIWHGRGEEGR